MTDCGRRSVVHLAYRKSCAHLFFEGEPVCTLFTLYVVVFPLSWPSL